MVDWHEEMPMAFNRADSEGPPDHDANRVPRYTRRLSDKILLAFHHACDQRDIEVAWELLNVLEAMAKRTPILPGGNDRRAKESLVAAHERLWQIRHPEAQDLR
jgi:hypothetical protein